LTLLAVKDLERYQKKFPNKEGNQEEWSVVIRLPGEYVNLLVGQKTNEDLREESDEENYYDNEYWDKIHKNYFLAYDQVKAHARWCASRPDEADHYKRFQVITCIQFLYLQTNCNSDCLVILQLWYSQQAAEGNAPGHPLGYRRFGPIKMVGGGNGGGENNDATTDDSDGDGASHFSG
jgi:hypothetical protein